MVENEIRRFKQWMEENTPLMERTIRNYVRMVKRFFYEVGIPDVEKGEPTIESINKFIHKTTGEKRNYYVRASIIKYLEYLDQYEKIIRIVKIKTRPKKKKGCYVSSKEMGYIINNIRKYKHKVIALIQYLTGARAHDVIGFKYDNYTVMEDGTLKMTLAGKGGTEYVIFIPQKYADTIVQFIKRSNVTYPFLSGNSKSLSTMIDNNYRYYYNSLKQSVKSLNYPEFATHDFRRNFIDDAFSHDEDIRDIQLAVGHSKLETTVKYLQKRKSEKATKSLIEKMRG